MVATADEPHAMARGGHGEKCRTPCRRSLCVWRSYGFPYLRDAHLALLGSMRFTMRVHFPQIFGERAAVWPGVLSSISAPITILSQGPGNGWRWWLRVDGYASRSARSAHVWCDCVQAGGGWWPPAPGPRNIGVEIDGGLVVIPRGNLVAMPEKTSAGKPRSGKR